MMLKAQTSDLQVLRFETGNTGNEQTLADSVGQERLLCCIPWGCKELDMTEWQNDNKQAAPH